MLHKYKKAGFIEAEQFDGSDEMLKKYSLMPVSFSDKETTDMYLLATEKEGQVQVGIGDYIATNDDGDHWVIDKNVFERTYERVD